MARIRSIKPEYWTDGRILELSDSCALFFIGLWNFCEDDGKIQLNPVELKSRLGGRWDVGKVRRFIGSLSAVGLVSISSDAAWLRVNNWKHQRIDKPRQPEISVESIQWLDAVGSTKVLGAFREDSTQGLDRKGKDRIGEDHLPPGSSTAVVAPAKSPKAEPITNATWGAYSEAYEARYKTAPKRNASVNGKLAQFVKRIGQEEAPDIAAFYLGHNDYKYVKAYHSVGLLLMDAEKLHTEWITGQRMTDTRARQTDRTQSNFDAVNRVIQRIRDDEANHG